jgi:hypothetical protein
MSSMMLVASVVLIVLVLWDVFEVMLLPRRMTRRFRLTKLLHRQIWSPWVAVARRMRPGKRREAFLSVFGPLFILMLFAAWAIGLILGFALIHWSIGTPLSAPPDKVDFLAYFYFSGVTFVTLGYGDVVPVEPAGRMLAVLETGIGFGFLAVVISYLPVLYQAFSRREVIIALFDARAGSPPRAAELLSRMAPSHNCAKLDVFLQEWERWAAELLESHISFPILGFYRSQHDNQSWLATLTAILDTSALVIAGVSGSDTYQARLTFATARHAAVDLAQAFQTPPLPPDPDRLPPDLLQRLRAQLRAAQRDAHDGELVEAKLTELRQMYEPFVNALGDFFLMSLPPILSDQPPVDNWQTSAWMRRTQGLGTLGVTQSTDDHDE